MDDDKDGVIQVDHVMKVIELLGTTHAKLPAKQIKQIVDMLAKEEMLEMEDNIEESMDKSIGSAAANTGKVHFSLQPIISTGTFFCSLFFSLTVSLGQRFLCHFFGNPFQSQSKVFEKKIGTEFFEKCMSF